MDQNYQHSCRFCLKTSPNMQDIFTYSLQPKNTPLTDFVSKLTQLKIVKGEFLPSNSCTDCIDTLKAAYNFTHTCIESDDLLKKEETRLEFRKIEQEALLDLDENEHKFHMDNPEERLLVSRSNVSVKSEDMVLRDVSDPTLEFDIISNFSSDCDQPKETDTLYNHQIISSKEKYTCDVCEMKFSNKMKFFGHQKMHDHTKPFKCTECFQGFSKEAHLKVHERCHTTSKDKKFSCTTCNKQFMYEYLLKQHKFTHSAEKPYPCPKCEKGCITSENLKRHMKIHEENHIKQMHKCTICEKEFHYPSALAKHIKLHTGEKPHLCPTCGKRFRQLGALHFHQRTHSGYKPFKCELCTGHFKSKSLLKVHMRKHTDERPFICDSCGMAFRQSYNLKCHLRVHTGERPVLCTLCGKRMSTTGNTVILVNTFNIITINYSYW
ncbi:zinc finger protein 664-like [Anthonomus grandis grandis]|uniref:zinc finger protein 664-like n=1 Tax=Anthonomus grandis grandis TaxID=2921223 RepID=UPI0021662170|nr:zinc finger protein 664-like [Anthonomus grandis grandis]